MPVDGKQQIGEIVRQYPQAVAVFETFGIDYCCGGGVSIENACSEHDLPLDRVLSNLAAAVGESPAPDQRQWTVVPLGELSDHIVERHHGYAKRELPRLAALAAKVELVHGGNHPELQQVREIVDAMASEMAGHMFKEEEVLFPRVKKAESASAAGAPSDRAFWGSLLQPIPLMMSEHDDTGQLFRSLRLLTYDYDLPEDACASYQTLYRGLVAFEADTHWHVHLENNILFPRALEFEKAE